MATTLSTIGFVVIEWCEDYEQVLSLDIGKDKPPGGVLTWAGNGAPRVFFASRKEARAAITRTEHYRKAFSLKSPPEAKLCRVEKIAAVKNN